MKKTGKGNLWNWLMRPIGDADISAEPSPEYIVEFELKEKYATEKGLKYQVSGEVKLFDQKVVICCDSEAEILPVNMISIIFTNEKILQRAKELNLKSLGMYRIVIKESDYNDYAASETFVYQEAVEEKPGKLAVNLTVNYENVATKSNAFSGNLLQLYRIYQEYGKKYLVEWHSEYGNTEIIDADVEWKKPQ